MLKYNIFFVINSDEESEDEDKKRNFSKLINKDETT